MTHDPGLAARVRSLRDGGASYRDIIRATGLSKSTIRYMVRDVVLTEEQTAALASRVSSTAGKLTDYVTPAQRRRNGRLGGRLAWSAKHRKKSLAATRVAARKGHLVYRIDELPTKEALERKYDRVFHKERIGNRVVDFASDDMIVEHSADWGKGLGDLIGRFSDITDDPRKKIAYINMHCFGPTRRARLEAVTDEIHDFRALAQE